MTRQTITITAPNGAKVRTVHSKRLFVVSFDSTNYVGYDLETRQSVFSEEYRHTARVAKRTDSYVAALAALNLRGASPNVAVYATWTNRETGKTEGRFLTRDEVASRARSEKESKKFAARVGANGPARSLYY